MFGPESLIVPLSLAELTAELPGYNDATLSLEDQARSVLHLLLSRAENAAQPQMAAADASLCPNCDAPTESLTSPYCGENCREHAAFIRQLRAALRTGSILAPEKQVTFGQKLWWILGGGLPLRESIIPESAKRQVARRSGGKCETCGAPMTTVENFGSGCNRPLHLRAVCPSCSMTKPFCDPEFTQSPQVVDLLTEFGQRLAASPPLRLCDDPDGWDWRAYLARRRVSR